MNMSLERIYYIGLRRSNRNVEFRKRLALQNYDMSMVERHEGHDPRDYETLDDFFAAAKRAHPEWDNELPVSGFKCLHILLHILYGDPDKRHSHEIENHARNQRKITPRIYKNFRSFGEKCMIISPADAKMFKEAMLEDPTKFLDDLISKVLLPRNIPGCYSVVDTGLYVYAPTLPSDAAAINRLFHKELSRA